MCLKSAAIAISRFDYGDSGNSKKTNQSGREALHRTDMKTTETTAGTLHHSRSRLATKEEARNLDREATEIIKTMKTGWLSLGLVVKKMIETRAFEQLGFTSMRAWMESRLREQTASAYQALRAVRALDGIPISQLERIGTRNAQVIARLPEKERRSNEWIARPRTYQSDS